MKVFQTVHYIQADVMYKGQLRLGMCFKRSETHNSITWQHTDGTTDYDFVTDESLLMQLTQQYGESC